MFLCWFACWFLVLPPLAVIWMYWPGGSIGHWYSSIWTYTSEGDRWHYAVGQGVTGNAGMECWLILASSRWHRWVRWWAPKGRQPTPGCRSSRRHLSPAPTPDSSPCRWWLRSSQTNLQEGKKVSIMLAIILFNYQIMFLCSIVLSVLCPGLNPVWQRRRAGQCFPEGFPPHYITVFHCLLNPNAAFASLSCSAPPCSDMAWSFCQTPAPPVALTFQLARLAACPVSFLFGWVGTWVPGNALAQYREQT